MSQSFANSPMEKIAVYVNALIDLAEYQGEVMVKYVQSVETKL